MSQPIIKVEGLSKSFTISHQGREKYVSLRDVVSQQAKQLFSLGKSRQREDFSKEEFWALRDLNFEIHQGDRVGIIGRNGAGKSTLLKVLSRITDPTGGRIEINGRVASLLEVGTGFHPELSGRENIFLNGAILGMSRAEIKNKFDEIVAFAEVERFLDTPVKRYSSGMYVRLAFAVAAHLEPEILIVDEVLAVGDAQFQKKCLGKMQDVSKNEGRTILFVSHNLQTVKNLCSKIIYMKDGKIISQGGVDETIAEYLFENKNIGETGEIPHDFYRKHSNGQAFFRKVLLSSLENLSGAKEFPYGKNFKISLQLEVVEELKDVLVNVFIGTSTGEIIAFLSECENGVYRPRSFSVGFHEIEIEVNLKLLPLNYSISAGISYVTDGLTIDWVENVSSFSVSKVGIKKGEDYPWNFVHGFVEPETKWLLKN
jgi:lipopolysaccharide transport system ATP-binding protein